MMNALHAIENSALAGWFLISMWGFPVFIALHSVGMAFVVGLSLIVALRYLGFLKDVSQTVINKLISIAWLGFLLNLVTGLCLLLSRVTEYLFDRLFLIKIAFVILAIIGLRSMQLAFQAFDGNAHSLKGRSVPVLTIFCWFASITSGRLIAYFSGLY